MVKASACNMGDPGSIPGWGRLPGEGNGVAFWTKCACPVGTRRHWGVAQAGYYRLPSIVPTQKVQPVSAAVVIFIAAQAGERT